MNPIPRVLFVITDSGIGGAEKKLLDILKNLDRRVISPCGVIVLKTKREMAVQWEKADVPVFEFKMGRWPTPGIVHKIRSKAKELSADLIHSLTLHSVLLSRYARKRTNVFKLVSAPCLNFRSMPFYVHWLLRGTGAWDDTVVCESTATREFLVERLSHDPQKAIYVPNAIDTNHFKFSEAGRTEMRKKWGLGDNEVLIGSVGRLHEQKGFDVLIEALSALRHFPVKWRAAIVGEGKELKRLQALAQENDVPVLFTGNQENMVSMLSAFDIYVQASRYEGMSRALMEAMSMGLPIVATSVDGTMDLAQDGQNMLLCRPEDAHSLSLGIATLMEKKDLRKKLATVARSSAEQFTVEKMVRRLEKIYQEI